jgi:hypothetical protein
MLAWENSATATGSTLPSTSWVAPFSVYFIRVTSHPRNYILVVYDAGAGDANDAVPLLKEDGLQSAVMQLARAFHGAGFVLEHRYYGQSIPFVQKVSTSTRIFMYII